MEKLRLISYTMVKNEEDIIEVFIRKNLEILDHMYISDNLSQDRTRRILNDLIDEGLPITIWDDLDPRHLQSKKTTNAYHKISQEDNFDGIFFIDSDEFLLGNREEIIKFFKVGNVYEVKRIRYVINNLEEDEKSFFKKMEYRLKNPESSKSMIFHDKEEYKNIRIGEGNHYIYHHGKALNHGLLNLKIAHFPMRTKEQFIRKNLLGWLSLMQINPDALNEKNPVGKHWRNAYQFILDRDCTLSNQEFYRYLYKVDSFQEISKVLIHEPIVSKHILKYTNKKASTSVTSLLAKSFQFSIEYQAKKEKDVTPSLNSRIKEFLFTNKLGKEKHVTPSSNSRMKEFLFANKLGKEQTLRSSLELVEFNSIKNNNIIVKNNQIIFNSEKNYLLNCTLNISNLTNKNEVIELQVRKNNQYYRRISYTIMEKNTRHSLSISVTISSYIDDTYSIFYKGKKGNIINGSGGVTWLEILEV